MGCHVISPQGSGLPVRTVVEVYASSFVMRCQAHSVATVVIFKRYFRFRLIGLSTGFNSAEVGSLTDIRAAVRINRWHLCVDNYIRAFRLLHSTVFLVLANKSVPR